MLLQAAATVSDRIESRGEQAALVSLGDSAIIWDVRIWCHPDDFFRLSQELKRAVKYGLDKADIGIPYPQMDVHVDPLAAGDGAPA